MISRGFAPTPGTPRLFAVIAALLGVGFLGHSALHTCAGHVHPEATRSHTGSSGTDLPGTPRAGDAGPAGHDLKTIRRLAGPYAHLVVTAAKKAHVSPRLVAAVVHVENGGNFRGSPTRVSSAGAIGVMQLEPNTAWNLLRVNPWNAHQNIDGGARYLAMMLRRFHGDVRLALMAYNAGPTSIAQGSRPAAAAAYAREVMRDAMA